MIKRKVTIKDTLSNSRSEFVTTASTYGELASDISYDFSGKRVVIFETQQTLQLSDAKLPDGDFRLLVMPEKTKSGSNEDLVDQIDQVVDFLNTVKEAAQSASSDVYTDEELEERLRAVRSELNLD